jgi:hypothetical protein
LDAHIVDERLGRLKRCFSEDIRQLVEVVTQFGDAKKKYRRRTDCILK